MRIRTSAEPIDLDFDWIKSALGKRRANSSNIVCFETLDPRRRGQVLAYLVGGSSDYRRAEIYVFDYWNGLRKLNREKAGKFEPADRGIDGAYDGTVSNQLSDLKESLRFMDGLLRKKRVVFSLSDLDEARDDDKNQDLLHAIRAWAYNSEVIASGSLVILNVGSVSRVLDNLTADLTILKRPEMASSKERAKILEEVSQKLGTSAGAETEAVVLATAGLNLHQVRSVLVESYYRTRGFPLETINDLKAEFIRRTELVEVEEPDARGFASVGGYEAVKRFITGNVVRVLKERERAEKFAVSLPRGILFFGPPGTGKTLFAKALARETNLPFINLRTENLFSKFLGESGQRFREAIRLAEQMSPAIVFIDEIDRFGKRSGGTSDGASEETRRVFNQVLEWLGSESRKAVIVGTTNRPQDLDKAFTRAGRFDYKIPFPFPGATARKQILEIHLGVTGSKPRPPFEISDSEFESLIDDLVDHTQNFSGAELEQMVLRAKRNAFNRGGEGLAEIDLRDAINRFRIDPDERARTKEEFLGLAAEYTDDETFRRELEEEK